MAIDDDTPEGMIARLDDALARRGRNITIRRVGVSSDTDVDVVVRERGMKPEELIGIIDQSFSRLIMSPTSLKDTALPTLRKGDQALIGGRPRNIEFINPIYVGDTVVRIELTVAGG